ncbi:MAG: SagB/ThcOx family dehydrogenase [Candidatus Zixiibacteriota bacterium]
MRNKIVTISFIVLVLMGCYGQQITTLPDPSFDGEVSLEKALKQRRSRRNFEDKSMTIHQAGQLLWAAYGISLQSRQFHTAPSAGATFPSELYLIARDIEGLEAAIYHYKPKNHSLELIKKGDYSRQLQEIALNQKTIIEAQCNIIIAADFDRTMDHYSERGRQYVYQESGHIGQNIYLQAEAIGLGTVAIGAFDENKIKELIDSEFTPIYIFPIGNIADEK